MDQHDRLDPDRTPSVLFVCVKNGGKSQMAAALMRQLDGGAVTVESAGTKPGEAINTVSAAALAEVGIDISHEVPKMATPDRIAAAGLVVTLGSEARVEPIGNRVETWVTDEPSQRGIEGLERMRLIRDDIDVRVRDLARQLGVPVDA